MQNIKVMKIIEFNIVIFLRIYLLTVQCHEISAAGLDGAVVRTVHFKFVSSLHSWAQLTNNLASANR